jgi:hypothetical protein
MRLLLVRAFILARRLLSFLATRLFQLIFLFAPKTQKSDERAMKKHKKQHAVINTDSPVLFTFADSLWGRSKTCANRKTALILHEQKTGEAQINLKSVGGMKTSARAVSRIKIQIFVFCTTFAANSGERRTISSAIVIQICNT